jgi:hypothetical protein
LDLEILDVCAEFSRDKALHTGCCACSGEVLLLSDLAGAKAGDENVLTFQGCCEGLEGLEIDVLDLGIRGELGRRTGSAEYSESVGTCCVDPVQYHRSKTAGGAKYGDVCE